MTTTRPEFARPPLVEQAITLTFERLPNFSIGDFGRYWVGIADEFSDCGSQPTREQVIEQFDTLSVPRIEFRLLPADAIPRAVYSGSDGHEQIQVQPDQFTFTWVAGDGQPYPRSSTLVARFKKLFAGFAEYVLVHKLGLIQIVQCEIVYVNIVAVSDFGSDFSDAHRFFKLPVPASSVSGLNLESHVLQAQYTMSDEADQPYGRLRQTLTPVVRIDDNVKAYRFELAARGQPKSTNLTDALAFFERARDAINATFVDATTTEAHLFWGLQ